MRLYIKHLKWKKKNIIVLILCGMLITACERQTGVEKKQPKNETTPLVSPTLTPVAVEKHQGSEEMTKKEAHEFTYKENIKTISVFKELVKLDRVYLDKPPSEKEVEIRRKNVFKLVDGLNGEAMSLITLARMSQVFRHPAIGGLNYYFAPSIYDTAFLYCVKTIASKHKNIEWIMSQLKGLKNYIVDQHTYADYILAFDGKDPMFLYDKEPDPVEIERIKSEYKIP